MFYRTSQKRYPSLCRYIDYAASRQNSTAQEIGAVSLMTVSGISASAALVVGIAFGFWPGAVILGAIGAFSGMRGWQSLKSARQDVDRLDIEAAEANVLLGEALKRGKLHKVAGEATTTILEECARHWQRTRQALDSPFWSSPNLPPHYRSVREQSARAADRAMDEVVVLLHNDLELPANEAFAEKLGISDLVEGVFGVQLPGAMAKHSPLPVAYEPVRHLAEKLKTLADNVEALTLEVAKDPSVRSEFHAETALDICITELQSIREAETELRQNIGG